MMQCNVFYSILVFLKEFHKIDEIDRQNKAAPKAKIRRILRDMVRAV